MDISLRSQCLVLQSHLNYTALILQQLHSLTQYLYTSQVDLQQFIHTVFGSEYFHLMSQQQANVTRPPGTWYAPGNWHNVCSFSGTTQIFGNDVFTSFQKRNNQSVEADRNVAQNYPESSLLTVSTQRPVMVPESTATGTEHVIPGDSYCSFYKQEHVQTHSGLFADTFANIVGDRYCHQYTKPQKLMAEDIISCISGPK